MRFAPSLTRHVTKLLENGHDWQLFWLQIFGFEVPNHQVGQAETAQFAALCRLQIIHKREDSLALGCVGRYEKGDDDQ